MDASSWREEVAALFEQVASSLREKSDRRALVAFGTAIAYLQKAHRKGQRTAGDLLSQLVEAVADGPTQRFTFSPGELEAIENLSKTK